MKTIQKFSIIATLITVIITGCSKDFDELRKNTNAPDVTETAYLLTYAQKEAVYYLRGAWMGGRTTYLLSQYWTQRNYTDEDRYAFRTSVVDNYWRGAYITLMNLEEIIRLNKEEPDRTALFGNNDNQIAVAKIMQVYIFNLLTDMFGPIPYSQAFKKGTGKTPEYDDQKSVYDNLLKTLDEVIAMIKTDQPGFTQGDIIYEGKMDMWKKFAYSLKLRIALRMSGVDPAPLQAMKSIPDNEFISSVNENTVFKFKSATPNTHSIYVSYFVDQRNDFTVSKPFVNLLKGVDDTLNSKTNPLKGIVDPRLSVWATPIKGKYLGMPYGMSDGETSSYSGNCPNFYNNPSPIHKPDYPAVLMSYAEVCFILSEINNWDDTWYKKGIRASMEEFDIPAATIDTYITGVPAATKEMVLTQKYLALYSQPEQGWFEYRRTAYPTFLLKPGEITHEYKKKQKDGTMKDVVLKFEVSDGKGEDIPSRLFFPIEERNINNASYQKAVNLLGGPDGIDTKVW